MTDLIPRLNAALGGRYEVERELGEGGMATVYLADDLRHERKVALKVLKPELAAVVGAERFLAEIKTTANLQHPHILPLFDSGEADGFVFYVMPYLEGESLRERLDREHQLPVDEAVRICSDVAEALAYAHAHGVIHRDIKPANILIQSGRPVVADFGIALAVGAAGGDRLTETGLSLGTPHYMSPEQAVGDHSVGPAADVYALGCVLYEMLVAEPPYTGGTPQAVLGKIVTQDAQPVTKHRRSVPPNVDAAIRRALEKVPADRFASATAFAQALGDPGFRHGMAETGAGPLGGRSQWTVAAAAAVVGGLVTGAIVWMATGAGRADAPRPVDRFALELPGAGALRPNTVQPMEMSTDGRSLFLNVIDEQRSRIYVRRLDGLETTAVPATENVGSFFVSPDGRWVGYNSIDGTLRKASIDGGQAITVTSVLAGVGWRGASWGPDGTIVFATRANSGLMRVSDAGGTAEPLTAPEWDPAEGGHALPQFLPDGEHLLFVVDDPEVEYPQVALLSLSTGEYTILTDGDFPQYVEGGYLAFRRGDAIWAADLDVEGARLASEPIPVVEGLMASDGRERTFSLSWDGTLVYAPQVEGDGTARALVWVNRQGQEEVIALDRQPYVYPRVSPTGDRLAVAVADNVTILGGQADLWAFDLERLAPTRVTFGGNHRFYPVWTPDGSRLTHADGATNENHLLWTAADGVGGTDTLLSLGPRRFPTSWSPDGRTLAYYAGPFGMPTETRDLYLLHLDGDSVTPEPFLATPFQDRAPVFSPDGRWIAYVSDKSGRNEVYVLPYPGPGPESTISTTGGAEPVWSRDGTELFFRTEDALMVVDVQLGETFRAGQPRPLFEDPYERDPAAGAGIPNYDVFVDGERFVMVRTDRPDDPEDVIVVQNWVEELREMLGNP